MTLSGVKDTAPETGLAEPAPETGKAIGIGIGIGIGTGTAATVARLDEACKLARCAVIAAGGIDSDAEFVVQMLEASSGMGQ
jgi:hypothetical protein